MSAAVGGLHFPTGRVGPSPDVVIDEGERQLRNRSPAAARIPTRMARIEPDRRQEPGGAVGARTEGGALSHRTSEGIPIVARGPDGQEGDEVIISNTGHPANVTPWHVLRDRAGIVIRGIDPSPGTDLGAGARTRLVGISHGSRHNGRVRRTEASAERGPLLRKRGISCRLDGAPGPGLVRTRFGEPGGDGCSPCGHKGLPGPKRTGALPERRGGLDRMRPSGAGAHRPRTMDPRGSGARRPDAARHGFGTRALADLAGCARAVRWMEGVGPDRIHTRVTTAIEGIRRAAEPTPAAPATAGARSGNVAVRRPRRRDPMRPPRDLRKKDIPAAPVRGERDCRMSLPFFDTGEEVGSAPGAIRRRRR